MSLSVAERRGVFTNLRVLSPDHTNKEKSVRNLGGESPVVQRPTVRRVGVSASHDFPGTMHMRPLLSTSRFAATVSLLTFLGCSIAPKTFRESTLDDMYPVLSSAQYDSLKSLSTEPQINAFVESIWHQMDVSSGAAEGTWKAEYLRRLDYARLHYPDRPGYGRSDRKRIYLMMGPPASISRGEFTDIPLTQFTTIKAFEIWEYLEPRHEASFPTLVDDAFAFEQRFIFADLNGQGNYVLVYSGNDHTDIDPRLYPIGSR